MAVVPECPVSVRDRDHTLLLWRCGEHCAIGGRMGRSAPFDPQPVHGPWHTRSSSTPHFIYLLDLVELTFRPPQQGFLLTGCSKIHIFVKA
jgi:hypothetical protein